MVAAEALSEQDVAAARAELSAGRPVTVWFTSAAVGVPAGGSAKVVAVGEPAEGDFIQIRPTGSRDTMFCSPGELTRTRPARKRAQPPARSSAPAPAAPAPAKRASAPPPTAPPARQVEERAAPRGSTPAPPAPPPAGRPERPRSGGGRASARPAEVTVTLSATGDGEWTVEVTVGKKRTVRPIPVQPGDVAAAARALPPAVAEAIASSLEAARRRRQDQVERLRAELEAAEQALHELSD
ncbi:MAG: hypothetical protein QOF00_2117 [Pseudonocardiales bacterium]|jgi:hypothetical protein|nr:hypothetical protein [Pseudonocardiales bacterium]